MPGQNGDRAVELLEQHDPYQLMRPGSGSEGDRQIGPLAQARRESVGAANQENYCSPAVGPPLGELACETGTVEAFPMGIEQYHRRTLRNDVRNVESEILSAFIPRDVDITVVQTQHSELQVSVEVVWIDSTLLLQAAL